MILTTRCGRHRCHLSNAQVYKDTGKDGDGVAPKQTSGSTICQGEEKVPDAPLSELKLDLPVLHRNLLREKNFPSANEDGGETEDGNEAEIALRANK